MKAAQVFKRMQLAIDNIGVAAKTVDWKDKEIYANWLAQSFYYVQWTTRQLALASAYSKNGEEDALHWRFIEEAKEEKRHEYLILHDLKQMGRTVQEFPELPHATFFYQTLSYQIERIHPIAILGYSLTLEGFAAQQATALYAEVKKHHGETSTTFLKLHCEVDVDHFANALPYLESCPAELLPVVDRAIAMCEAIYVGILRDVTEYKKRQQTLASMPERQGFVHATV